MIVRKVNSLIDGYDFLVLPISVFIFCWHLYQWNRTVFLEQQANNNRSPRNFTSIPKKVVLKRIISHLIATIGFFPRCLGPLIQPPKPLRSWATSKLFMRRFETVFRRAMWGFWYLWLLDRNLRHPFLLFGSCCVFPFYLGWSNLSKQNHIDLKATATVVWDFNGV